MWVHWWAWRGEREAMRPVLGMSAADGTRTFPEASDVWSSGTRVREYAGTLTMPWLAAGDRSRAPTGATQPHGSDRSPQRRPLDQFDEDDSFVATTLMDEYYAGLAETWLGVPVGDLLP